MTFDPLFVARHMARLFAALLVSEPWNASFQIGGQIHRRARAVVVFDRALNQSFAALEDA